MDPYEMCTILFKRAERRFNKYKELSKDKPYLKNLCEMEMTEALGEMYGYYHIKSGIKAWRYRTPVTIATQKNKRGAIV